MRFAPFQVEEFLSKYEHTVELNYSESGVHPLRLGELLQLAGDGGEELMEISLNYPQVNGEQVLRERIAALYGNAGADNVLVTVGASEANLLAATTLLEPGDEIAVLRPTYAQFAGIACNMGVEVRSIDLLADDGWRVDVESLAAAVTRKTKVVAIVNPNNPTGSILTEGEIEAIVEATRQVGATLLVDEVYAGAERDREEETPSLFGRYEKTLVLGSLSKAYGLPGLRVGWVVSDGELIERLWRRHEYAVISTSAIANRLAAMALDPDVRAQIIARTRRLIRSGYEVLVGYLREHGEAISLIPPQASAVAFLRLKIGVDCEAFAARLREDESVLVVPGVFFGSDDHVRFSYGLPQEYLHRGLVRINRWLVKR